MARNTRRANAAGTGTGTIDEAILHRIDHAIVSWLRKVRLAKTIPSAARSKNRQEAERRLRRAVAKEKIPEAAILNRHLDALFRRAASRFAADPKSVYEEATELTAAMNPQHRPRSGRNEVLVGLVELLQRERQLDLRNACRVVAGRICDIFPPESVPELYNLPRSMNRLEIELLLADQVRAACRRVRGTKRRKT